MATSIAKEFDPNRKYKVNLSERLLIPSMNKYSIASIQLDQDLKLPQSVRNATLSPGFNSNECELSLVGAADGKESSYNGKSSTSKACALIFDNATGTFTLEQIDTQFAFAANNDSAESEEQSEAAILSALIEEVGEAEEDNPFDWRHQLQRQRTPSPELDQFRLDTGATPSPAPSPAARPVKARTRQASSPPGMNFEFEDEPSPERFRAPQREEFEIGGGEEEDSDEGGLQISWEGASKPKGFRGRLAHRKPDGAPISLRSAANSQSPAIGRLSSPESDSDVDIMQLGSPLKVQEAAQEMDVDDADVEVDGNEDVDDMEAELEKALEGDYEDDDVPAAPTALAYVADDSSSESEEE